MKTLHLSIIIFACSILILSSWSQAEGRIIPMTSLQLYKNSDIILVGNVTSIEIPPSGIHTFYHVKVEQYLKNLQQNDTITVVGSGPNDGSGPPDPKFMIGDRVRLYLYEEDGMYKISMYSTKANPRCYAHELLGLGPLEPIARGGYDPNYSEINCRPPFTEMYPNTDSFLPPMIQIKEGVKPQDVACNKDLQLIMKSENGYSACVTSDTAKKLVQRGWILVSYTDHTQTRIPILENDTGIVTLKNQTYYFDTPNYTEDAYFHPIQISFHDVVFTLFPPGFRGGLPTDFGGVATNGCGGSYYWTDAKFPDGIHELLYIFAISQHCSVHPIPTYFSNHTNPQAGLTFYDGKMKLLVREENQTSSTLRLYLSLDSTDINPAEQLGADISLNNTSSKPLILTNANDWTRNELSLGPCSNLPFGMVILKGYYTEYNMTNASSLVIYQNIPCPLSPSIKSYTFQPLSSKATQECDNLFSCPKLVDMKSHLMISGFIDNNGQHRPFNVGTYTIIAGDEWGHTAIQHFTVAYATPLTGSKVG